MKSASSELLHRRYINDGQQGGQTYATYCAQSSMTISFPKLNKSNFANFKKISKNKRKNLGKTIFVFRPPQFQEKEKTSFEYTMRNLFVMFITAVCFLFLSFSR